MSEEAWMEKMSENKARKAIETKAALEQYYSLTQAVGGILAPIVCVNISRWSEVRVFTRKARTDQNT
jgi:hypothetical protein